MKIDVDRLRIAVDLAKEFSQIDILTELCNEMINQLPLLANIPHYCGNTECDNLACRSVVELRDNVREIINKYGKDYK